MKFGAFCLYFLVVDTPFSTVGFMFQAFHCSKGHEIDQNFKYNLEMSTGVFPSHRENSALVINNRDGFGQQDLCRNADSVFVHL